MCLAANAAITAEVPTAHSWGGDEATSLQSWLTMVDQGVIKKNVAEVTTPITVNEFKAGQAVFAINWGFAFDRFKDDADSTVKGKVGVMPLPAMTGGKSATCMGGWQWALSAFSKNKAESAKLVKHLASPEASKCRYSVIFNIT